MHRRRLVFLSAIYLVLAATAAPCIAATLFRLDASAPGEADPDKASDYIGAVLAFNIYDTLVVPGQNGAPIAPHLATAWRADGSDYIFNLRSDVKFHSGNRMTADDVVFSFQRLMALDKGGAPLFAEHVASVVALDAGTVKFHLSGPFAPFIAALIRLPILDSRLIKANQAEGRFGEFGDYGERYLSSHDAGSGAYALLTHSSESETNLVKFEGYFLGVPTSAPDKVQLRYGLQPATVRELVASGEQEMTSQWLPPQVMRALLERGDTHVLTDRGSNMLFVDMNTKKPPLDDLNCRLALTYAFDYATAIKLAQIKDDVPVAFPADGPLGKNLFGYNADLPVFTQNLGKAKEFLSKCAYKTAEARKIDVAWIIEAPAEEKLALLMKSVFDALGFQATIKGMTWALYTEQVARPESTPALSIISSNALTPDPDSILYNMYDSKSPSTWRSASHLSDADLDQLLDQGRTETDLEQRRRLYEKADARIVALAPAIFAYELSGVFIGRNNFRLPPLEDESQRYACEQYGLLFRRVEMKR